MRGAGARVARHGARATRGAFGARGRYQWHPGQHSQVRHILQGFLNLNPSLSNLQVYSLHDTSAKFQVRCSMPREGERARLVCKYLANHSWSVRLARTPSVLT